MTELYAAMSVFSFLFITFQIISKFAKLNDVPKSVRFYSGSLLFSSLFIIFLVVSSTNNSVFLSILSLFAAFVTLSFALILIEKN